MPIEIPQLKQIHLGLMNDLIALRSKRIAWVLPDKEKDDINDYARYVDSNIALEDLLKMGLVEDITNSDESRPWLEALMDSGRTFRIFMVTKIGEMMMECENTTWRN